MSQIYTFPFKPLSQNQSIGIAYNKFYRTTAYKAFKQHIVQCLNENYSFKCTKDPISINIDLYYKSKRKVDIDNPIKGIFDALNGLLFEDDSQIECMHVQKIVNADTDKFTVQIETHPFIIINHNLTVIEPIVNIQDDHYLVQ